MRDGIQTRAARHQRKNIGNLRGSVAAVLRCGVAWIWVLALVGVVMPVRAAEGVAGDGGGTGRTLLVLGDSLAAGYGVEESQAFPALLRGKIEAAGLGFEVINAGVSGDTTAGGLRRLNWLLRRPVDVVLVELGGNDGLRGLPPDATRSNLLAIVDGVRRKNPKARVVLAGMQMPPNLGEDYGRRFAGIFPEVAREKGLVLVPHLLEGVGGRPELNLPDQIHPTPAGHAMVASNVWVVLKPVLEAPTP
jgi:acyl-CoA thioesterase-1